MGLDLTHGSMSSPCCAGLQVSVSTLPQLEKLSFTLQHMVIFRMVARTGSIKDAAMALSLSAGAVSKSIAALEQVPMIMHHICPCQAPGRQTALTVVLFARMHSGMDGCLLWMHTFLSRSDSSGAVP